MELALEQARCAEREGEVPVGCVIVLDGQCIGQGWNAPIGNHDPTAHAEIRALRDAALRLENYRLPGTVLYSTLEPCIMCAGALLHARVERLVYAAPDPRRGAVDSGLNIFDNPLLNHSVIVESGLMADEAAALLKQFFARRR